MFARLRLLTRLRLEWRLPKRVEVLIVFTDTSQQLREYFPHKEVGILDLDGQRRNVFALLLSIVYRRPSVLGYLAGYVAITRPRLILSMQDNFKPLWQIKALHPEVCIALVQNGLRSDQLGSTPIHLEPERQVDHFFCFNAKAAEFLGNQVNANFIPSGSFRSNYTRPLLPVKQHLAYISTYRSDLSPLYVVNRREGQADITYGEIWRLRLDVLHSIKRFCLTHDIRLRILGKDLNHQSEERFFAEALGELSFDFVPRADQSFQYAETDRARVVVSTGSTLGLESLSRGNRTAIFDQMPPLLNQPSQRFGWPSVLPTEGPFWSETATYVRIENVLRLLFESSDTEWQTILNAYREHLPVFDPGNSVFCDTLREFGAQPLPLPPSAISTSAD